MGIIDTISLGIALPSYQVFYKGQIIKERSGEKTKFGSQLGC